MIPLRLTRELAYQLERTHEDNRLARTLSRLPVFVVMFNGEGESDLLRTWKYLAEQGYDPDTAYTVSLEESRTKGSRLLPEALLKLNRVFESRGAYSRCIALLTELLEWSEQHGDETRMVQAENRLGSIHTRLADYPEALTHLTRSRDISERLGDMPTMLSAIGNMGVVYMNQGRYDEAFACFERQIQVAEPLHLHRIIAFASGAMGMVHRDRGQFDDAMRCLDRQLRLVQTRGDKSEMSHTIGHMGLIHMDCGRFEEARACFERNMEIDESLGDTPGVSMVACNLGIIHLALGEYSEAFVRFEQTARMCQTLGNKRGEFVALGNTGDTFFALRKYDEALEYFRRALAGHRAIGFRYGMTYWLRGIAQSLIEVEEHSLGGQWSLDLLREARENAEECLRISRELEKPGTTFLSQILLARISAMEEDLNHGIAAIESMFAETTDEEQIAELHYWLWSVSTSSVQRQDEGSLETGAGPRREFIAQHGTAALDRYTSLFSNTPRFEFRKRIAELQGEPVPESADSLTESNR